MDAPAVPRRLKQFVLKPTVFCYHRCPYCDPRQDYYRDMVSGRKKTLPLAAGPGSRRPNPGHMPLDMALRTIDEAAALGMEELQLSGGDPLLYPHLTEVIRAARKHPGVFVLMNSVGTGLTAGKAREIIEAGLGAWNFSVDTLDPVLYERLRGVRGALPAIMNAITAVREAGAEFPGFRFNYMTVITRHNFRGLPELLAHCVDTGAASVYLMNVYGDTAGQSLLNESLSISAPLCRGFGVFACASVRLLADTADGPQSGHGLRLHGGMPFGHVGDAGIHQLEAFEEALYLAFGSEHGRRGSVRVRVLNHAQRCGIAAVAGAMREREITARSHKLTEKRNVLPRVFLVPDEMQYGHEKHSDRPGEVNHLPQVVIIGEFIRMAGVAVHDGDSLGPG